MSRAALISRPRAGAGSGPRSQARCAGTVRLRAFRGFTLIELMIVMAIMGILVTISVPITFRIRNREPLNQAVRDVMEVLSNARARAILQGTMTEVIIHPKERRLEVGSGSAPAAEPKPDSPAMPAAPVFEDPASAAAASDPSGLVAVISNRVTIEMLDVNLIEYKDAEYARVRFYPNGTCDEFTLIMRSEKGEWIKVWLELTTSLANVGPVDR